MKCIMEYFLIAEEETKKYEIFNSVTVFSPYFLMILDNQQNDILITIAINALNELIIRPIRYQHTKIYKSYFFTPLYI